MYCSTFYSSEVYESFYLAICSCSSFEQELPLYHSPIHHCIVFVAEGSLQKYYAYRSVFCAKRRVYSFLRYIHMNISWGTGTPDGFSFLYQGKYFTFFSRLVKGFSNDQKHLEVNLFQRAIGLALFPCLHQPHKLLS